MKNQKTSFKKHLKRYHLLLAKVKKNVYLCIDQKEFYRFIGLYLLDLSKYTFGGIILTAVIQTLSDVKLLFLYGFVLIVILLILGLIFLLMSDYFKK